jgi:hypothetical protein
MDGRKTLFHGGTMKNFLLAIAMVAAICGAAEAGPFGRRTVTTTTAQTCTSGVCGSSTTTERSRTVTRGHTATAAGVAELQAAECSCRHHGGNAGFEGVGCGSSPQAALVACCSNGRPVIDEGVAQGRDGRFYACRRYAR